MAAPHCAGPAAAHALARRRAGRLRDASPASDGRPAAAALVASGAAHRARPPRHPQHPRAERSRPGLWYRRGARAGPPVADGAAAPHRRWPAGRGPWPGGAAERPLPARAGRSPRRAAAMAEHARAGARAAAGLHRRRQRRAGHCTAGTAAGVRAAGPAPGALDPGGQPELGPDDGLGPGRQLQQRAAAPAAGAALAGAPHRADAATLPGRVAAAGSRLRGALPWPAGGQCTGAAVLGRPDRAAGGRGAAIGYRGHRLQCLGAGRQPHAGRQAAAGQRPAPAAGRTLAVVFRAAARAGAARGRRQPAGPARGGAGRERAPGLGLHQHRPGRAGPVPGTGGPGRPEPLPHARGLGGLRDDERADPRERPAGRADQRAPHPARPGRQRRDRRRQAARRDAARRPARLCAGSALDRAGA